MHSKSTLRQAVRTAAGLALAAMLLLSSGCGTETGDTEDGPAPLPKDTYQRVLSQGANPALVYTIELSGLELAEQSAGVLGDSDYGAVYLPAEPPFTTEVHLEVTGGRTGGDWHGYVVSRAGHHLTVDAPSDAVDPDDRAAALDGLGAHATKAEADPD